MIESIKTEKGENFHTILSIMESLISVNKDILCESAKLSLVKSQLLELLPFWFNLDNLEKEIRKKQNS